MRKIVICSSAGLAERFAQLLVASLPAEAPLDHNFRSPRIRELLLDNDAIALGNIALGR